MFRLWWRSPTSLEDKHCLKHIGPKQQGITQINIIDTWQAFSIVGNIENFSQPLTILTDVANQRQLWLWQQQKQMFQACSDLISSDAMVVQIKSTTREWVSKCQTKGGGEGAMVVQIKSTIQDWVSVKERQTSIDRIWVWWKYPVSWSIKTKYR